MNAVGLYVSAARLVLQHDPSSAAATTATTHDQSNVELLRLLPHLRQSLSCAVCCRMLCDPYALRDAACQHNVCRLCVRGRKNIRPNCSACKDCQDFKIYEENKQMRCLLLCYKSLCEQMLASPIFQQLCRQRATPLCPQSGIVLPTMSAQEFIMEGASYEDVLSAFANDLPHLKASAASALISKSATIGALLPHTLTTTPTVPPPVMQPMSTPTQPLLMQPVVVKQEQRSSTPNSCSNVKSFYAPPLTTTTNSSALTVRNFKNMVDLSSAVQLTAASMAATLTSNVAYVSHAPTGLVVSSSNATPLSIASSKLQSFSRQLAQQQQQRNLQSIANANEAALKSGTLTLKLTSAAPNSGVTTTTATVTSQLRQPPPIKTVSNGSAMYSVLYTGIGNKITIKRKTDADDDGAQRKNMSTSTATATAPLQHNPTSTVFRQVPKANAKRRGCRCGNATPTPGKLTCCGQRCPCYVDSKSCIGCKCRGCRNPHRPDGGKVRPVIPELACYEIQMADSENSTLSPGELPIGGGTAATSSSAQQLDLQLEETATQQQQQHQQQQQQQLSVPTSSRLSVVPTSSTVTTTVVPYRSMQQMHSVQQQFNSQQQQLQQLQQQQQQQQQQSPVPQQNLTQNLLNLEHLQRESLVIQSAEGKYQVVNVFTTTSAPHNQNANLQRIHTLPQLQAVSTAATSSSNSSSVIANNTATYLLHQPATNNTAAISNTCNQMPEISTTLPQIIMQQQQRHHQQQQQHTHVHNNNSQQQQQQQQMQRAAQHLQQQLKAHSNVITVHPISSHAAAQPKTPATIAPSTITLSPIIVSSSPNNTYSSSVDMFSSDSNANEYLHGGAHQHVSISSSSNSSSTVVSTSAAAAASSFAIASGNTTTTLMSNAGVQQHLAPAYVELIESNDLRFLRADDLTNS